MPPWCDFFWPNRRPAAILGTCKKVLAIALCCASACPDGAGAAPKHPLDPLAAEELLVIRDVLASSGRFSQNTKFAWIELEEPAKSLVERFEPDHAFPRRAQLAALDFGRRKSFAVTVDLAARRLDGVQDLAPLQPGLTDYDLERARQILDSEPKITDALVRHGLQISGAISDSVRELFLGVGEDPALKGETGRLVRVLFISDQDAIDNFGPILDSVMAVVDVQGGRVVQLYDVPGVPSRKVPHDIFDAKIRGAATPARPLRPVQAQGANFVVDGNAIRWGNWQFRFGFNVREGLVLHQVRFDDNGRQRSILYRASVAEVVSRYGDPTHAWPGIEFLDEGNFGLGHLSVPVAPGREQQRQGPEAGQHGGPEEQAALLPRVQRRPGVEDREIAAGVRRHVLDVEVVLEQRPFERKHRDHKRSAHGEDRVPGAALEVGPVAQTPEKADQRSPDSDEKRKPEAQAAEQRHLGLRNRFVARAALGEGGRAWSWRGHGRRLPWRRRTVAPCT